jgi:multiple sugar transport system permease protein
MKKKEQNLAYLFLLPSLAGTSAFVLAPFADVIRRSFYKAVGNTFVGTANYRGVLENQAFQQAAANTVRFLCICLPLLLFLSFGAALMLYSLPAAKALFQTVFLLPMAVPVASLAVFWKIIFHGNGLLNEILELFRMKGRDWMGTDAAFWILVFSYIWKNMGYDVVLWIAALSGIGEEQYEAARVSGAGSFACFFYITLPQMKPGIVMIGILSFVNAFRVFREAYLIAGDYPHESIYMLQHLFNNWFTKLDIQKMSAAAVMMAFAVSMVLYLLEKWNGKHEI